MRAQNKKLKKRSYLRRNNLAIGKYQPFRDRREQNVIDCCLCWEAIRLCRKLLLSLEASHPLDTPMREGEELLKASVPRNDNLPFADNVRGLDPCQRRSNGVNRLEAKCWAHDPLDETMVLFNHIV